MDKAVRVSRGWVKRKFHGGMRRKEFNATLSVASTIGLCVCICSTYIS